MSKNYKGKLVPECQTILGFAEARDDCGNRWNSGAVLIERFIKDH